MNRSRVRLLSFHSYVLDLDRRVLSRDGYKIQMRPKAFDVLCYLAENAGRVIPKEEVMLAVWPHANVTDDSIVQCVKDIRQALGDNGQEIVTTISGRGYLFAADKGNPRSVSRP